MVMLRIDGSYLNFWYQYRISRSSSTSSSTMMPNSRSWLRYLTSSPFSGELSSAFSITPFNSSFMTTRESVKVLKTRNSPSCGKDGIKILNFEPLTLCSPWNAQSINEQWLCQKRDVALAPYSEEGQFLVIVRARARYFAGKGWFGLLSGERQKCSQKGLNIGLRYRI